MHDDLLDLKLREAHSRFYRSASAKPRATESQHETLAYWEMHTPDPPLRDIDGNNALLFEFRESLLSKPGLKGVRLVATTANKHLRQLNAILNRFGPKGPGPRRQSLGWIREVPWVEPSPEDGRDVRTASVEELSAIYLACEAATWPRAGFPPPDWWRALLVLLYNVGPRRGDFLAMPRSAVDWKKCTILVRQEKKRKPSPKPMNDVVAVHLRRIWEPERELLLPGVGSRKWLYEIWKRIQRKAGIVQPYCFHEIRKTCGTALFEISPGAAQEMLGHSSVETTRKHYANLTRHTIEVSQRVEQPEAFLTGSGWEPPPDKPQFRIVG